MEYLKQAHDFLEATNSTLDIKRVPSYMEKKPLWDGTHGLQYVVKLSRNGKEYRFDFWDSYKNMEDRKKPNAYDVLTCLDTCVDDTYSLGDFMSEFGCEVKDVDNAQKALSQLQVQARTLRTMYSEAELDMLNEIN